MEISPVFTILGIINTVISMIACPIIAGYKNRSVAGWIFGGLFLGLIGLIIVACLPHKDYLLEPRCIFVPPHPPF